MKIDKINDEFIVDCTNNSREERQQVYKFLVDNREYTENYLRNNYAIIVCNKEPGDSNWGSLTNYYRYQKSKRSIPVYTFEQFKEMYLDEFVLPEKWCIKDCKEVTEYAKKILNKPFIGAIDWKYFHSGMEHGVFRDNIKPDYTEITLEQFKKYVLKEEIMKKEIIGYKLIKPEYEEAAIKITGYVTGGISFINYKLQPEGSFIEALQEAGVLDLWFEPIYEEKYKVGDWITITEVNSSGWLNDTSKRTFQIDGNPTLFVEGTYWKIDGGKALHAKFRKATPEEIKNAQKTIIKMYSSNKGEFEIEVVDRKAYYRPENKELPKEWIRGIINSYDEILIQQRNVVNPYNIKIAGLHVGCYQNCRKEDWENVYKLIK